MDVATIWDLRQAIIGWKKKGKTILIAEHRLYYLMDVVDRIIILQNGQIERDIDAASFWKYDDNALYLQLLDMQKAFTEYCEHQTLNNLPTSDEIQELQTYYNNMLTAIIDLLDGAKYLWEGEHHETK